MVRRSKKKTTRRSKSNGVSLIGAAETFMLLNVASNAMFRNNIIGFLSGPTSGAASGTYSITLRELMGQYGSAQEGRVYGPTAAGNNHAQTFASAIGYNLKQNWLSAAGQMILIPIGFRLGKSLAKPAISRTNRLLSKGGIAKTVKL